MMNDPYAGGSHKPDAFVVVPTFASRGVILGHAIAYSHHIDVGGRFAGGISSHPLSSYEEGLTFPPVKLYERGVRNDAVAEILCANVRSGDRVLADVEARTAGCRRAHRGLDRIVAAYGQSAVDSCLDADRAFSESVARSAIECLPPGPYSASLLLDDDGFGTSDVELPICVEIAVSGSEMSVDLADTAPQLRGAMNMPLSNTLGRTFEALHSLLGAGSAFNCGLVWPIAVKVPEGTLLNPTWPAAIGGRAPLFYLVNELVPRALEPAMAGKVPASSFGGDALHIAGWRADGSEFSTLDLIWGSRGPVRTRTRPRTIRISGSSGGRRALRNAPGAGHDGNCSSRPLVRRRRLAGHDERCRCQRSACLLGRQGRQSPDVRRAA